MTDITVKLCDGSYITITEVDGGLTEFTEKWHSALKAGGAVRTSNVAINASDIVYVAEA